ncbi:uncharacterized protein METZ01_LOCUS105995 [marine metagenome]|uniref:DUF2135 domain-containing protein n=1 Tax=marine metagenome TaxID=408172 RepID=A0A381WLH4_9ZZZZ
MLFIIAFLLISPVKKKKEIEQKAEYVITITWPGTMSDDIDSWLEDPMEKVMYFREKEVGLMHLDRDDLGKMNDQQFVPGVGMVNYPYNREITTIRGIMPGEYVFNIHLYRKEHKDSSVPVTVILEKLNPQVKLLYSKVITLSDYWEEKTVIRFVLDVDGEITESFFMYKPLVEQVIGKREDSNTTGLYDHQPPTSSSGVHSYDPAPQPPQKRDEE